MGPDSTYSFTDTARFMTNALTGQMRIVQGDGGNYFVNMSVMLVGELMSFNATIQNDTLVLDRHDVTINVTREGSKLPLGSPVNLAMSGKGRLYSDTIMFEMAVEGEFNYIIDGKDVLCKVLPRTCDIVCEAYKNK